MEKLARTTKLDSIMEGIYPQVFYIFNFPLGKGE
jgi:hypothetical protein